jgi:hypothetical protein
MSNQQDHTDRNHNHFHLSNQKSSFHGRLTNDDGDDRQMSGDDDHQNDACGGACLYDESLA